MKLERFRDFDGIKTRASDKKDKFLFHHCAGSNEVFMRDEDKVKDILFLHGVGAIEIVDLESVYPMTKQEFELSYIKGSSITLDDYNLNFVTLECNCGSRQCKGWAAVSNNPRSIKSHIDLYVKDSAND